MRIGEDTILFDCDGDLDIVELVIKKLEQFGITKSYEDYHLFGTSVISYMEVYGIYPSHKNVVYDYKVSALEFLNPGSIFEEL